MIQDIGEKTYYPEFEKRYPAKTDYIIYSENRNFLMRKSGEEYLFPTFADTKIARLFDENGKMDGEVWKNKVRINHPDMGIFRTVAIDNENYYVVNTDELFEREKFQLVSTEILRHYMPMYMSFGVATAAQISRWMGNNRYCGRCGKTMYPSEKERAMACTECGNMVFPKICPAVTISIIHNDKILLVRNKSGVFHRFAQVAGYVEIGETFEDTVYREALEETGMLVKNVRYYKNQPWAMTDAQMIGYRAELDIEGMVQRGIITQLDDEGFPKIKIQEEELLEARWFSADEIPPDVASRSLTYEMIGNFRKEHIEKTGETGRWEEFSSMFDTGL